MRRSLLRTSASLLLGLGLSLGSDMRMTVDQLVAFIKSSVTMKHTDRQVAEYLKHVKLTNKLDDQTIETLQGLGAGSKTVSALKQLGNESATLSAPPAPPPKVIVAPIPGPDSIEQAKIIDKVRQYALNYTKQLPNFICLQVTQRYYDPAGGDSWHGEDKITTRVSYNEHKEEYKVVLVNDKPVTTDATMEKLGGTVTAGEFGSMMDEIFVPDSKARFGWDHWATLRGKRVYVFSYDIDQAHSKYQIKVQGAEDYVPAYHGLLYVDKETNVVLRITLVPYELPPAYPVQQVKSVLDYDYEKIGESVFLVPQKVVVTSRLRRFSSKNDVEFRAYRRFGADTVIKFDTPELLPEEKEKPVKP
ncbi:MAG: hypothetical protein ACR2NN_27345 [Bryobacteraceae bacterium]